MAIEKNLPDIIKTTTKAAGTLALPIFCAQVVLRGAYDLSFISPETVLTISLSTIARTMFAILGVTTFCFMLFDAVRIIFEKREVFSGPTYQVAVVDESALPGPLVEPQPDAESAYSLAWLGTAIKEYFIRGCFLQSLFVSLLLQWPIFLGATITYVGAAHLSLDNLSNAQQESVRIMMTGVGGGLLSALSSPLLKIFDESKLASSFSKSQYVVFCLVSVAFAGIAATTLFDFMPNLIAMIVASSLNEASKTTLKVVTYIAQPIVEGLAVTAAAYVGSVFFAGGFYASTKITCKTKRDDYEEIVDGRERIVANRA